MPNNNAQEDSDSSIEPSNFAAFSPPSKKRPNSAAASAAARDGAETLPTGSSVDQRIPQCHTCFTISQPNNSLITMSDDLFERWKCMTIVDDRNQAILPFQESVTNTSKSTHRRSSGKMLVSICDACWRQFERIETLLPSLSLDMSSEQVGEELRRLYGDIMARRQAGSIQKDVRDISRVCTLAGRCETPCSDVGGPLYHPRRLKNVDKDILQAWISRFMTASKASKTIVQQLCDRIEYERLCTRHTSLMSNELTNARAMARSCSLCNFKGTTANKRKVTRFDWESLNSDESVVCVIEDAVAVFTNNTVKPADIKRLCCGCRRVVTRNIDMKEKIPRDEKNAKAGDRCFEHGPTPRSVRKLIVEIRRDLWDTHNGKHVVFLTDVRKRYEELVILTGEMEYRLCHNESLKKYLLPSLAKTDIHLQCGSKKIGSYFCTRESFDTLAAEAKQPRLEDVECSRLEMKGLLDEFRKTLEELRDNIDTFNWKLHDFIKLVPKKLWFHEVDLVCSKAFLCRARAAAKISRRTFDQEWPFNPKECPENLQSRASHEFSMVSSVFDLIEKRVFLRSSRRVRGPIRTALTVAANEYGTTYLVSVLNRLGIIASYQHLDSLRRETIEAAKGRSPFDDLVPGAFVTVGIDNINMRAGHSLAVHGKTHHGFDGLAMQGVNSNTSFDYANYVRKRDPADNLPKFKKLATVTRELFVRETVPRADDKDILAYTHLVLGSAVVNRNRIAGRDPLSQASLRRVVMDSLQGFSGGKARLVYVEIRQCNPNHTCEIIQLLRKVESYYNPPDKAELTSVGVVGDQPIFKILFLLWVESFVKQSRLCKWMVPIPGGFHMDKQGLIPVLKQYGSGSGFEALLPFSGLSSKHQEGYHYLSHYRKNRRFLSQTAAAEILRLEDVLKSLYPDLSVYVRSLKDQIAAERTALREMSVEGRNCFLKSPERLEEIRNSMPPNTELALSPIVSPNVLKIGKTMYDKIKSISNHSVNMNFYGLQLLINALVPWTGYNILTRKGQTGIVDKFYFRFVGLMHGTTKINYQELSLFYGVVRYFMPQTAFDTLYKKRHLVYTASEKCTDANDALDGGVESGIILDSKTSNVNNPAVIWDSVYWLQSRAGAKSVIKNELDPSRADTVFHSDADNFLGTGSRKRDREKATAVNVAHMLDLLTEKEWLGESHIANPFICNILSEPPIEIKDPKFASQLIEAEKSGMHAASMHLSCKISSIFGDLTDEERKLYFGNKSMDALRHHWRKKIGSFLSMSDYLKATSDSPNKPKGFQKKQKASLVIEKMHKRYRSIMSMRRDLDKIIEDPFDTSSRRQAARQMKASLDEHSHVQCAKSYAFRKDLETDDPYREPRLDSFGFFNMVQEELHKTGAFLNQSLFLERDPKAVDSGITSLHLDLTADVKRFRPTEAMGLETVEAGGAVFAKMSRKIMPYITSERYKDLLDVHIHVDIDRLIPEQVLSEKHGNANEMGRKGKTGATNSSEIAAVSEGSPEHEKTVSSSHVQAQRQSRESAVSRDPRVGPSVQVSLPQPDTRPNCDVRKKLNAQLQTLLASKPVDGNHDSEFDVKPSVGNTLKREGSENAQRYCGTRTILSENWSSVISAPHNRRFLTYLHAVSAAKAAIHLLEERRGRTIEVENRNSDGNESFCSVYVHGASITITDAARNTALSSLEFSRSRDSVLVLCVDERSRFEHNTGTAITDGEQFEYDDTCCWRISQKGFERFPAGDSKHGQSITRMLYALRSVTISSLAEKMLPAGRWKALLVSENEESAIVTLLSDFMCCQSPFLESGSTIQVLHKFGEGYVDVNALKRGLNVAKILPEDLSLLYALSGNSICPSTRHVTKKRYVQSYFEWMKRIPRDLSALYRPFLLAGMPPGSSSEDYWVSFETLLASAFLCAGELNAVKRETMFEDLQKSPGKWAHQIRTMLAMKPSIRDPSMFMPEREDVELQVRRALWNLKLWKQASQECCGPTSAGGSSEEWGFRANGYPLFEREVDLKRREEIIKTSLRICKCTTGCLTKRCSCRNKDSPSPCVLCQCKNCKNHGDAPVAMKQNLLKETEVGTAAVIPEDSVQPIPSDGSAALTEIRKKGESHQSRETEMTARKDSGSTYSGTEAVRDDATAAGPSSMSLFGLPLNSTGLHFSGRTIRGGTTNSKSVCEKGRENFVSGDGGNNKPQAGSSRSPKPCHELPKGSSRDPVPGSEKKNLQLMNLKQRITPPFQPRKAKASPI